MSDTYFIAGRRTPFVKAGTVFADETPLTLSATVMKAMQGHVLGKAVYGGLFRRPQ